MEKLELVRQFKEKTGIPVQGYSLVGLDGDTIDGFRETTRKLSKWMDDGLLDYYWTGNISVSRGTKMFAKRDQTGLISLDSPPYHFIESESMTFSDWLKANYIWRGKDFHFSLQDDFKKYFPNDFDFGGGKFKRSLLSLYSICKKSPFFDIVSYFEYLGEFQLTELAFLENDSSALIPDNVYESIVDFCGTMLSLHNMDIYFKPLSELVAIERRMINFNIIKESPEKTRRQKLSKLYPPQNGKNLI